MNLQLVSEPRGYEFTVRCAMCKQMIPAGTAKIADLDGRPFEAYYHTTCTPVDDDAIIEEALRRADIDSGPWRDS